MPLWQTAIVCLLVLGVAALGIAAWRSWRFDNAVKTLLTIAQTMVSANAKRAEIEHEREQRQLYLDSQTTNERVELERVKLAREKAVEYNALEEELNRKGREVVKEFREIGAHLTETIPSRHPATVQADGRARPPASAVAGNGGRHRREAEAAEAPN